jgi:hypothetical protein
MFFRRRQIKPPTFEERLAALRSLGFSTDPEPDGPIRASQNGCAARIGTTAEKVPFVEKAGLVIGNEIAALIDGGYQKFWRTPSGRTQPALAEQLKSLHDFEEDLREALGLESLYNTSLGTTFDYHLYDRVQDRDRPIQPSRPWNR